MENNEMIETIVPISIDNLKKYFENKEIKFLIDYDSSQLQGEKFLIYISNLDIPCDINLDNRKESHIELIKTYMTMKNIVNLPSIENEVLAICLEAAGYHDYGYGDFIEQNVEIVEKWLEVFRSLSLYNIHTIANGEYLKNDLQNYQKKTFDGEGINFVNFLKYEETCLLYETTKEKTLYFYEDLFNEYMFNGNNLFHYWQNENNRLFLLTWSIFENKWNEIKKQAEEQQKSLETVNDSPV